MEELFQYMKTLRSQINDEADQAAKMSVEEQMQCTTIQTLEKELESVKNGIKQVKLETDHMAKAKGEICLQILETQKKIAAFGSDYSTLCQTLELMQQERLSLSTKLFDRRAHYTKVNEDICGQLKEQQEWLNNQNFSSQTLEGLVNEKAGPKEVSNKNDLELLNKVDQSLMIDFKAAQAKFDKIKQQKSNLVLENTKLRQSIEQVKAKINNFKPELREADEKTLQEELQALLSDKAEEAEYVQSLQDQIKRLKELSHSVRCSCGEEYNVQLDLGV